MRRATVTVHACLVDIDGVGVLITGESGTGKTSACLEMMARGHKFVADDAVLIECDDPHFYGSSPPETSGLANIRGVGVVKLALDRGHRTRIGLIANLTDGDDYRFIPLVGVPVIKLRAKIAKIAARSIEDWVNSHRSTTSYAD